LYQKTLSFTFTVNGLGSKTAGLAALIWILKMDIEGPPCVLFKTTLMENGVRCCKAGGSLSQMSIVSSIFEKTLLALRSIRFLAAYGYVKRAKGY
jgi:hypothetical protein